MNHVRMEDNMSWCGQQLDNTFFFKDLDQLIINNEHGERIACFGCVRHIVNKVLAIPRGASPSIDDERTL